MKQSAKNLLPGTVVRLSTGEMGTLREKRYNVSGALGWIIDFEKSGARFWECGDVQILEIV